LKNSRGAAHGQALILALAGALLLPVAAHASPTFLTAINISDAGQDAGEPQVAVDANGNSLMVWSRFDGTNYRIQAQFRAADGTFGPIATISQSGRDTFEPQVAFDPSGNAIAVWTQWEGAHSRTHAAFRPAGGSFASSQAISPSGQSASGPQISIDSTGKAVAVWYRFDGTFDRVQAAVRPPNGSFGAATTLSMPGVEAYDPQVAAGPDADANTVAVWTGSDGTNLRVQSARRKDYVGYPRPISATLVRVPLVVAYDQCTGAANRTHGPPLAHPSCNPPPKTSSVLTVGTPDANGFNANSSSSVRWKSVPGDTATEANEADVQATIKITDVRVVNSTPPNSADYTGRLGVRVDLKITDQRNAPEMPEAGTTNTFPLEISTQCVSTVSTTIGADCSATTSLNALLPGAAVETRRAVWQLGQTSVRDAGANGTGYAACPPTCGDGDEKTFLRQGIFVP
jgi:hypothetical protein